MNSKERLGTLFLIIIIIGIISTMLINNKRIKNVFNDDNNDFEAIDIDSQDLKVFEYNIETKDIPLDGYSEKEEEMELFYHKYDLKVEDANIIVYKDNHILELYVNNELIGRFKIYLGQNPVGDKKEEGDLRTPEGNYYICTINDKSKFKLFLGLSYPNIEDAKMGLENNIIDQNVFSQIEDDINNNKKPLWNSSLGGAVGIHGVGNFKGNWRTDWTVGCIALSDGDIERIGKYVGCGTTVEIRP